MSYNLGNITPYQKISMTMIILLIFLLSEKVHGKDNRLTLFKISDLFKKTPLR